MTNGALLNRDVAKKELEVLLERLRVVALENIDGSGDMSWVVAERLKELSEYVRMVSAALRAETEASVRLAAAIRGDGEASARPARPKLPARRA